MFPLLLCLFLYIISVPLTFAIDVFCTKLIDGKVSIRDLIRQCIMSIIPVCNIIFSLVNIWTLIETILMRFDESDWFNKKIF